MKFQIYCIGEYYNFSATALLVPVCFKLRAWSLYISVCRSVCQLVRWWSICQKEVLRLIRTVQVLSKIRILKCAIALYNHKASSAVLGSCNKEREKVNKFQAIT